MVRHVQVAVFYDQVRVVTRFNLTVLVKQDVLAGFAKSGFQRSVCRQHGHISYFRVGLTVNLDLSVFRSQVHILVLRYGLHARAVAANRDVAFSCQDTHVPAGGLHGLYHVNVAFAHRHLHVVARFYVGAYRNVARLHSHVHIVACGHVSSNIDGAIDAAGTHGQINILPGGNVFSNSDRTFIDLRLHAALCINIMGKIHIALVIYPDDQVPFGNGIFRYRNAAVIGMQGQIAARKQLAVVVDDNIL